MSQILANNLLTQQFDMKTSQYKMVRQPTQTGGNIPVSTAGGQQAVFEVPPSVYNWSKSRFEFTCTPAASGTTLYNYCQTDGFTFIRTMKLTTRSGVEIFSCDDVAKFTNMVMRRKMPVHKAQNLESGYAVGGTPLTITYTGTFTEGASVLKANDVVFYRPTDNLSRKNQGELTYLWPINGTIGTADPIVNVSYPLGLIFESLFEEDKSLFLGNDVLYLTITFNASNIPFFTSTAADAPATGPAAYAGELTLSNLNLYLAQDTNLETINMLKSKVASPEGLRVLFKHPIYNKLSLSSTTQNASVKYNASVGKRLKTIYHAIYNGTETSNTAFDHNNLADAKCSDYYITITDNNGTRRMTDQNLDTSAFMDYKFYKDQFVGSAIQDANDYYYNWVVETNLGAPQSVDERNYNNPTFDNIMEGMPLDHEIKYDAFMTTTNANYNHYIFGIVMRELLVNSNGITIIN